jgi:alpha-amylase/alpha-mannosidase (GH57 family)
VSAGFLPALSGRGPHWFACGGQVLDHSLRRAGRAPDTAAFAQPWRFPALAPDLVGFFRDDTLSDLIGFEYRRWHGGDAAAHFLAELEQRAALTPAGARPVVTAIVDGENAWEYYPYNGFYFLSELYGRLAQHPSVRTRTPREILAERAAEAAAGRPDGIGSLPGLVAGSWVYGDLTTWIGAPDKNHAWDLLVDAKRACDVALASGRLDAARRGAIARQLAVCESSDWYWWFGDYNPAESVAAFDGLFRNNLERLYTLIDEPPPPALAQPVSRGSTQVQSEGAIRRAH